MAVDIARFGREVRDEIAKVTWPTRKETALTVAFVIAMAIASAVFFLVVDQAIGVVVRALLGLGS